MMSWLNTFAAGCATKGIRIIPPWYEYVPKSEVDGRCELNFVFPDHIGLVLLAFFEIVLRVGALIAIVYVIYGGFQYMLSQGEPDKTKDARTIIINAVVGLVITTLGTVLVNFVGGRLTA